MISLLKKLSTLVLLCLASCNFNNPITVENPPIIFLDNESGIYSTKIGQSITIAPSYDYVANAIYTWSINDSIIGINPSLVFTGEELGSVFIKIKVETESGSDEEEIRVDVVEREIPTVSLVGADKGYTVSMGEELTLRASVRQTSLPTTYSWTLNNNIVSDSLQYTFIADSIGIYNLMFRAENEDGADSISSTIEVVALPPISWTFAQTEYQLIAGRTIEIGPVQTENLSGAIFRFAIGDSIVQEGEKSTWLCSLTQEGDYLIDITATLVRGTQTDSLYQQVSLKVISTETLNYRPKTASSQSKFNRVYEYTPAPGQFINEKKTGGFDDTQTTPETAIAYAEKRLNSSDWVSLGGFGGYIVVGFDHSIDNSGAYDFGVLGNSVSGSSEPGIVWVMQDENGDGLPND
ncbi:MAG: cell surface protein, partial [Paludibacteraceae bacterium]|nr:cell surface protein [Paludibacteraceae bacterium]